MRVRRRQGREVVVQAADTFQADLWAHADYGTLGDPLFDLAAQLPEGLEARGQGCEVCGQPCDLRRCDDCIDAEATT